MKKILKDNWIPTGTSINQAIAEGTVMKYFNDNGYECTGKIGSQAYEGWEWVRKHCVLDDWNFMTFNDLTGKALTQFRNFYNTNSIPGSVEGRGVSIDGYNTFARWGKWKGGYVANLGWISEPSASVYGASLYINSSWTEQGQSETPLYDCRFYAIRDQNAWYGGYVDGWGYVSPDCKVLGSSTNASFLQGDNADKALVNLLNFGLMVNDTPPSYNDLSGLQQRFAQCWDSNRQAYEIDDQELQRFLHSKYQGHEVAISNIREALSDHRAVLLRLITRTEPSSTGIPKRYGNDYVILYYNALLRTYAYIDPISGKIGNLDAAPIDNGSLEKLIFAYDRKEY